MMRKILFFYFLCLAVPIIGQVNIDSLWTIWNNHNQADTIRFEAINKIAWDSYLFSQPDSAYYFAQLGYDFAKSKGLKKQMSYALNTQGVSFWIQDNYVGAIDYYTRSLTIKEEIGDKEGIAGSLNNIGIIYKEQGDYTRAIDYFTRSLTIYEEIGNQNGIANTLNNIGIIYQEQGDYVRAIDYYTRSLTIKEEIGDKQGIAASLNNIGIIYKEQGDYVRAIDYYTRSLTIKEEIGNQNGIANTLNNIGIVYYKQGNYDRAIDYYTRSLTIFEEIGNQNGIANTLNNIGVIYKDQGDYARAIDYYSRSLTIREETGDKMGITGSLNNIGMIYKEQGDYTSAITNSTRALTIAQEIGAASEIVSAAKALYESYKDDNMYKPSLEMYELYIATRDSIDSEENRREVIRQEYKYKYDKQVVADSIAYVEVQRVQEAKLEKSKTRQLALIGGLVLFIVFSVSIFIGYRQKNRSNKLLYSLNDEIKQSYEKLSVQAEHLQISKKKLQMANKELEAFSYSVSHDLRAPLRAIDGFTRILMEDYVEKLDVEGKRLGSVIQQNARKLGKLIDDLLAFSRLGRSSIAFSKIDMKNLVNTIYDEAVNAEERKRITFSIADLPEAFGDTNMLHQVWMNLISNAIKFSSHCKQAVISVTCREEENKLIYCIKDNGAGFDMKYKDKLFGVFQRLHSEKEFEGTGVGLALVQRIIHRHDGEVWAEGEVDKGAAFYFSLPKQNEVSPILKER